MTAWFEESLTGPAWLVLSAAVVLLLTIIVMLALLVLWLRARKANASEVAQRVDAERAAIELELSLREQLGRLRIVGEIQDVAVSSVSQIIAEAEGAAYASATEPTAGVRALATIADAARSTLADLRRSTNVVTAGEAAVRPQPRMPSARDLIRVMRDAGLVITPQESGEQFPLQKGAELAIHSLLEEAFSNALKYGGAGTEVALTFHWRGDGLQVQIDDDGVRNRARLAGFDPNKGAGPEGYGIDDDLSALTREVTGPGITEMRGRVEMFGGVLTATPVPGVGFSISASFPALRFDNGIHGVNLGRP